MRKLKSWWRNCYSELRIGKRRNDIIKELQEALRLDEPPVLKSAGGAGHDSIYRVFENGMKQIGVLRLLNPWRERDFFSENSPFILTHKEERIEREFNAYLRGAEAGLTPAPLWRTKDALLCSYLPYESLQKRLLENPENAEEIMSHAAARICDLHRAGIIHTDTNLSNILSDKDFKNIVFIDFEYKPALHLSLAEQQVFDHLRALESAAKFLPAQIFQNLVSNNNEGDWFHIFINSLTKEELKSVRLASISPALGRILSHDAFRKNMETYTG